MLTALTLVSPDPQAAEAAAGRAADAVAAWRGEVKSQRTLGLGAIDLLAAGASVADLRTEVGAISAGTPVDVIVQAEAGRRKRLFLADMDSTIIGCECLDELADYAGVKAEVAAVTERAMRGELDFAEALRARVARLKGLPEGVLRRCYDERVRLNPGARVLVRTLEAHGARCVLVSGGFDSFTAPVAAAAGFSRQHANRLIVHEGQLTGEVAEPILGREAKLEALKRHAGDLGVDLGEAMAVGDGANDLAMIGAAGLGIAYRAKPVVAAEADAQLVFADLTALLYAQGYPVEAFVGA